MGHETVTMAMIALGGNLDGPNGGPETTIKDAVTSLTNRLQNNVVLSQLYVTPAFPLGSGPDFVNAAAIVPWSDSPQALLDLLHDTERAFGRTRDQRWEARVLDLDLLAFSDAVLPDPETEDRWRNLPMEAAAQDTPDRLILPHPRMAERAFVLVPLADVAPDWVHPVTGRSVAQMCAALPEAERNAVVRLQKP